jgi:hypothetical protein
VAPNHQLPIEKATLWDILDWDTTLALSGDAVGDPRDKGGRLAWEFVAKRLIDEGSKNGNEDEQFFHLVVTNYVETNATAAVRRQRAADIATRFGADPERLIEWIAFKWGLFKRTS